MDEDHDRQRLCGSGFGRDDVEGEAVFAHGLVFTDADHGVATLLRCAVGEAVTVPHPQPRLGRLRRPESQPPQRRPCIGDRPPAIHAVAGEALDSAGERMCANDAFMHISRR